MGTVTVAQDAPQKKGGHPPIKAEQKAAFLANLAELGTVTAACQAVGIGRRTVYMHRDADPEFAAAWDAALEQATEILESEARRRARDGSDLLLMFLLKGQRPEKYRDNAKVEVTGEGGGPVEVRFVEPGARAAAEKPAD